MNGHARQGMHRVGVVAVCLLLALFITPARSSLAAEERPFPVDLFAYFTSKAQAALAENDANQRRLYQWAALASATGAEKPEELAALRGSLLLSRRYPLLRATPDRAPWTSPPIAVAVAKDGKTCAVAFDGGTLRFFDLGSGKMTREVETYATHSQQLLFSPDGVSLIVIPGRNEFPQEDILLIDVATGKKNAPKELHKGRTFAVQFDATGRLLGLINENWLRIADAMTAEHLMLMQKIGALELGEAVFSQDGKLVAAGVGLSSVMLWEVATGKLVDISMGSINEDVGSHSHEKAGPTRLAFAPGGRLLAIWRQEKDASASLVIKEIGIGRNITDRLFIKQGGKPGVMTFSPDGSLLAVADDIDIELWDPVKGRLVAKLEGHTQQVTGLAFIPGVKQLVSTSQDRTIRVWDLETGKERYAGNGHSFPVKGLGFSPDGRVMASLTSETVQVMDMATGNRLFSWPRHQDRENSLAFIPDSTLFAVTDDAVNGVAIYDYATGKRVRTLLGHKKRLLEVSAPAKGRLLASNSMDEDVRIWDVDTGQTKSIVKFKGAAPAGVAFSSDGQTLAIACYDGAIRLWDVARNKLRKTIATMPAFQRFLRFSPDGDWLVWSAYDNSVALLDLPMMRSGALSGHTAPITDLAFYPGGFGLATSSQDGAIRIRSMLREATKGEYTLPDAVLTGHDGHPTALSFSPDRSMLATAGTGNSILFWNLGGHGPEEWIGDSVRTVLPVAPVAPVAPDGKTVLVKMDRNGIALLDTGSGKARATLTHQWGELHCGAFSSDGKQLVLARTREERKTGAREVIQFWDTASGNVLGEPLGGAENIRALALSPDNRILAVGDSKGKITLKDVATRRDVGQLDGHSERVVSLRFSPDGAMLVSSAEDSSVRFWRLASSSQIALMKTDRSTPTIAATVSGDRIAIACEDDTVRIVDASTGKLTTALPKDERDARRLAFSPDGARLAVARGDAIDIHDAKNGARLASLPLPHAATVKPEECWVKTLGFTADSAMLLVESNTDKLLVYDATRFELVALFEDEMWKHFRSFTALPEGRRILVDIENWSPFIIDLTHLQHTRPLDAFNKESTSFRLAMDKLQLRTKGGGEFNLYGEMGEKAASK